MDLDPARLAFLRGRRPDGIPPYTHSGSVPNLRFSLLAAYRRVEERGWSREVTARELPVAKELAAST